MDGLLEVVLALYCPDLGPLPASVVVFDANLDVMFPASAAGLLIPALRDAARRVIATGLAEADVVGAGLAARCTPMHANGAIFGVVCVVEDPVLASAAREMLAVSPVPIAVFDEQHKERYANRAWRSLATGPLVLSLPKLLERVTESGERQTIARATARPFATLGGSFHGIFVSIDVEGDPELLDAQLASTQKDRFIAMLSHELRAPLAAMLLWEKVLRDDAIDLETKTRALDAIHESASSQSTLVGDLLDISRAMTGKLHIDRHSLAIDELVETVIANVRPLAGSRTIDVDLGDGLCHVLGDAIRLRQVFTNLVENAIKCTGPNDRIQVRVSRTASAVEIVVEDNGRGIAPDVLPTLFEPFRQVAPGAGGLGLGLAITSQLVILHGGQVTAASAGLGRGATFRVSLPITTVPRTVAASTKGSRLGGVRVLVVDDDRRVLDALQLLLERAGATVETAKSADDGIRTIERAAPDVVLSDIAMPDGDGCTMMRTIREREAGVRRVPAVAMTAHVGDGSVSDALAAGFDRYITKPLDIEQLISTLARLVPSR